MLKFTSLNLPQTVLTVIPDSHPVTFLAYAVDHGVVLAAFLAQIAIVALVAKAHAASFSAARALTFACQTADVVRIAGAFLVTVWSDQARQTAQAEFSNAEPREQILVLSLV